MAFQSYQFRQINPDAAGGGARATLEESFNRINSGRSIPTRIYGPRIKIEFIVSIVSIQADQSRQRLGSVNA